MISIGIDVGSASTKAAAFNGEEIIVTGLLPTGWSPKETGLQLLKQLLVNGCINEESIIYTVGTGYGRVSLPFIDDRVTEITCHGRGAHFQDSSIRSVIDIGGQDSKVINIDSQGRVLDFIMNDKCAAGTGRFLQLMANTLEIDVSELSAIARDAIPQKINSMCTVFAESEIISLMAEGASKESIAAGLLESTVNRTYSLVSRIGVKDRVYFSGGVSHNQLLREMLGNKLKIDIYANSNSQYNGAIGAAIIGWEKKMGLFK